jgi:hypothetical protein
MKFQVTHQDSYSRGELLLRTLFGAFYIQLPHLFVLLFIQIGAMFINLIAFWAILITGKYPKGMWNYMVKWLRWNWRLSARLNNLADGYPAFGLNASDNKTVFEMEYPERSSRGKLLLRSFFGFIYILIPHGFCLLFLALGSLFVKMIAWWVVLITGKYPKGMHDYMVGVMRWSNRVMAYYYNLTDTYPPFSMKETESTSQALDHNI